MDDLTTRTMTRRRLLQVGGGTLAAASLGPLLAACGSSSSTKTTGSTDAKALSGSLDMWWWGEQEATGIKKWVAETNKLFKQEHGVTVKTNLLDTGNVISQFQTAAAAGKPPDVQFFWNGIYHMESVWLGYVEALNGLIPDDILSKSGATQLSIYQGKQYRVGWYVLGMGLAYNKELFDKAGLNPDSPPKTWDEFLNACDKIKSTGKIPLGGGVKDGYFGEWWLDQTLTQQLNSAAEAIDLFIGDRDWRDPKYHEHWTKLRELRDHGFINNDINSLDLYQGSQLLDTGKASMIQNVSAGLVADQKALGQDVVGFMIMPVFGTGKMAGKPIVDTQGLGVAAKSDNIDAAAALLAFHHSQERVNAIYEATGQIPADSKFDASIIDNPLMKHVHDNWAAADNVPYIPDLMPTLFWSDAMFVASQKILAGDMNGEQAGELAHQVTEKWKKQNPDLVDKYGKWRKDLAL